MPSSTGLGFDTSYNQSTETLNGRANVYLKHQVTSYNNNGVKFKAGGEWNTRYIDQSAESITNTGIFGEITPMINPDRSGGFANGTFKYLKGSESDQITYGGEMGVRYVDDYDFGTGVSIYAEKNKYLSNPKMDYLDTGVKFSLKFDQSDFYGKVGVDYGAKTYDYKYDCRGHETRTNGKKNLNQNFTFGYSYNY